MAHGTAPSLPLSASPMLLSLVISLKLIPCPPFTFNSPPHTATVPLPDTPSVSSPTSFVTSEAGDAARCY